jgi:5-formyltetrahydrofolate cyclo-ligase
MKPALRKQLRANRRSLSTTDHASRSMAAARTVTGMPMFKHGKRIALYLPFDREVDTSVLIEMARRRGAQVFVPVIVDRRHGRIRFYPLHDKTRPSVFGISVPHRVRRPVSARWLNLIVVPLVGVDDRGRRLGMGGGYYDRALEFRRRRLHWAAPHLVGLAFDNQRTTSSFADAWDLQLDSLATESGLQHFSKGRT